VVVDGWEVSGRRSTAALTIADETPRAKLLVRAPEDGATAQRLGVGVGRAIRHRDGTLVVGSGPGEWLLIGPPGPPPAPPDPEPDEFVSTADFTSSRALVRLTGGAAAGVLAKICAIDLAGAAHGTALRTAVAGIVTDVVRDDRDGVPSYLLHCERSSGQSLFDALLDAGREFDLEVIGWGSP
jgi:heterotetrameric sarcosine oxidase gamma subunit